MIQNDLYDVHYRFAGSACRDFPIWFSTSRNDFTGEHISTYYSDDGFGNLVSLSRENYLQLLNYMHGQGKNH